MNPRITPSLRFLLLTAAILTVSFVNTAAQTYKRTVERTFLTNETPAVSIDAMYGTVTVKGVDSRTVRVAVTVTVGTVTTAEARRIAEKVEIAMDGSDDAVDVTVDPEDATPEDGRQSLETNIEVSVPRNAELEIDHRFGKILVRDIGGSVDIDGKYCSVFVSRCARVDVSSGFGGVVVNALTIGFRIQCRNSTVTATGIPEGEISNEFGPIHVSDASGNVNIRGKMADINAKNIPGGRIENQYGKTVVQLPEDFDGVVKAKSDPGQVHGNIPLRVLETPPAPGTGKLRQMEGRVGKGKDSLIIVNENGSVSINMK